MKHNTTRLRRRVNHRPRPKGTKKIGTLYWYQSSSGKWFPFGGGINHGFNAFYNEAEITVDELHDGPPYRSGGPFKTLKLTWCTPYGVVGNGTYYSHQPGFNGMEKYIGGFAPPDTGIFAGTDNLISNLNAVLTPTSSLIPSSAPYSSKAWSSTVPKVEQANLLVSIREARDVKGMLRTSSRGIKDTAQEFHNSWKSSGGNTTSVFMQPKKAADHFLNHNFGWVPFVSDVENLINLTLDIQARIDQLTRLNGSWFKRKGRILLSETNTRVDSGSGCLLTPALGSNWYSVPPTWEVYESQKTHVYASGLFRFYVPEFDAQLQGYHRALRNLQRHLTTYGLRITPSNIWRSTPWTWLIDWFLEIDDFIDRLQESVVDGVASKYLYLMHSKSRELTFRQILPFGNGVKIFEFKRLIDSKERQEADSPYGFGQPWANLSPRQLAILAALGISRSK